MCDRNGPHTGAEICLAAIGAQDMHLLSDDPNRSLFKYNPKRHSNFRKYHRSRVVNRSEPLTAANQWPLNQIIKVQYDPRSMGDLLSNMYIKIEIPALPDQSAFGGKSYRYSDILGRHLFKSITMNVDEMTLEKYQDDWGFIHDNLYADLSEINTRNYSLNRGMNTGFFMNNTDPSLNFDKTKTTLMIPIPFFFSRNYESDDYETNEPGRPYFPLCAINKQKLEFIFEFRPDTFFTDASVAPAISSAVYNALTEEEKTFYDLIAPGVYKFKLHFNKFEIITEEITLEPYERMYYTNQEYKMITDIFIKHPTVDTAGENNVKLDLVPKNRVKSFHWFFRNTKFEDENEPLGKLNSGVTITDTVDNLPSTYFQNRFNITTRDTYRRNVDSLSDDIMTKAIIFINGEDLPNSDQSNDNLYFKNSIPFLHRMTVPVQNIYTYTFSMFPRNVEPSGSVDFGSIKSNRTYLSCDIDPSIHALSQVYRLNLYYKAYTTFTFKDGYLDVKGDTLQYGSLNSEMDLAMDGTNASGCKITY
jgi:hypothetical protein